MQLDFLFVLQPRPPAPIDEVVVVEVKRGTHPNGTVRRADEQEIYKFHGYVRAVFDHYAANTSPPRVRGLMIANSYTRRAEGVRRTMQQATDPKLEFRTWEMVIEETARMHLGWLEVSRRRAARPDPDVPPVEATRPEVEAPRQAEPGAVEAPSDGH